MRDDMKVQFWNTSHIELPVDPNFPFTMRFLAQHSPEVREQRTLIFGPHEVMIVQSKTLEALLQGLRDTWAQDNPLFVSAVITDADGNEVYRHPPTSTV